MTRTCALCVDLEETTRDFAMRAEDPDSAAPRWTWSDWKNCRTFQTGARDSQRRSDQLRTVVQNSAVVHRRFLDARVRRRRCRGAASSTRARGGRGRCPGRSRGGGGAGAFDPPLASVRDVGSRSSTTPGRGAKHQRYSRRPRGAKSRGGSASRTTKNRAAHAAVRALDALETFGTARSRSGDIEDEFSDRSS